MTDPLAIATTYIRLWNEHDPDARRRLLDEHWAADATYVDPLSNVRGTQAISAMIGAVQERYADFRFGLIGKPDGHGDHVRFSWSLGPEGAEPPIEGTDFAQLAAGRLASVTGFLDKVPGAAAAAA